MKESRFILIVTFCSVVFILGLIFYTKSSYFDDERVELLHSKVTTEVDASTGNGVSLALPQGQADMTEDDISSARATLMSSRESFELLSLDGEFARVVVQPGEVFQVNIQSQRFNGDKPIRIDADNGGTLNREFGPIENLVAGAAGDFSFSFALGEHRGLYTVEASQGDQRELFEFWVGMEPPSGSPGPSRVFSSPSPRS